jgi:hypothetical protein
MKIFKPFKALTLIAVCIASMALISGCHEEEKAAMIADADAFCSDFQNKDYKAMYALTHDEVEYFNGIYQEGTDGGDAIFDALSDNLEYEILDCKIDGDNASVNAKITNLDMENIMSSVINDFYEQCEANPDDIDSIDINSILDEHLNDENAPRKSEDTVFNFIKQDGKWVLESNVMIYDDVTGGYLTYYFQMTMGMQTDTETTTDSAQQ